MPITYIKKKKQFDIGIFIFDTYENACIPIHITYTYIYIHEIYIFFVVKITHYKDSYFT